MGALDDILFKFGIYPNQRGYETVTTAIPLVQKQSNILQQLTKQLYPEVGRQCKCGWIAVERSIRLAAAKAWSTNQQLLSELAQRPLPQPPTSGEFIWILCRYISESSQDGEK